MFDTLHISDLNILFASQFLKFFFQLSRSLCSVSQWIAPPPLPSVNMDPGSYLAADLYPVAKI